MKIIRTLLLLLVCLSTTSITFAKNRPKGVYFGQKPPGLVPEVFAPNIISRKNRYEYILVFSPNLNECIFGVTNSDWSYFTLMYTKMNAGGTWSKPVTAPFLGDGDGLVPAYSQDGNKIFFVSSRPAYPPANIWQTQRNNCAWTKPVVLPYPINTDSDEFGPSPANDEKLYFTSNRHGSYGQQDIYRSEADEHGYSLPTNLGSMINTQYNEASPFIAPDESYLIFESNRPGGYGQADLYISFFDDDEWSEPKNLGPNINTEQIEDGGYVSPDGKYFFFNRREAWVTNTKTDIHWVDIRAVLPASSNDDE